MKPPKCPCLDLLWIGRCFTPSSFSKRLFVSTTASTQRAAPPPGRRACAVFFFLSHPPHPRLPPASPHRGAGIATTPYSPATPPTRDGDAPAPSVMARPENLWLSPASLAKVDDDNYRAFIIDKAHLPFPENQSGSKRARTRCFACGQITNHTEPHARSVPEVRIPLRCRPRAPAQ